MFKHGIRQMHTHYRILSFVIALRHHRARTPLVSLHLYCMNPNENARLSGFASTNNFTLNPFQTSFSDSQVSPMRMSEFNKVRTWHGNAPKPASSPWSYRFLLTSEEVLKCRLNSIFLWFGKYTISHEWHSDFHAIEWLFCMKYHSHVSPLVYQGSFQLSFSRFWYIQ